MTRYWVKFDREIWHFYQYTREQWKRSGYWTSVCGLVKTGRYRNYLKHEYITKRMKKCEICEHQEYLLQIGD